jgi:hypothetical protein
MVLPPHTGLQIAAIAKLAAVVVATSAACWAPYLTSPAAALEVLQVGTANTHPYPNRQTRMVPKCLVCSGQLLTVRWSAAGFIS